MTTVARGPGVERQLGFRPECQSEGCEFVATVAYQAHPVDACHGRSTPVEPQLLCGACLRKALDWVQAVLLDAFLGLRPGECQQCGLCIVSLSDIIVRIQPLWIWSD